MEDEIADEKSEIIDNIVVYAEDEQDSRKVEGESKRFLAFL